MDAASSKLTLFQRMSGLKLTDVSDPTNLTKTVIESNYPEGLPWGLDSKLLFEKLLLTISDVRCGTRGFTCQLVNPKTNSKKQGHCLIRYISKVAQVLLVLPEELGRGGYGVVYEGIRLEQPPEDCQRAVKEARYEDRNEDLENELAILRYLRKKKAEAVVALGNFSFYSQDDNGKSFLSFSMKRYDTDLWAARELLTTKQVVELTRHLFKGLAFLHSLKVDVCHGDISPRNILGKGGRWVFSDFGSGVRCKNVDIEEMECLEEFPCLPQSYCYERDEISARIIYRQHLEKKNPWGKQNLRKKLVERWRLADVAALAVSILEVALKLEERGKMMEHLMKTFGKRGVSDELYLRDPDAYLWRLWLEKRLTESEIPNAVYIPLLYASDPNHHHRKNALQVSERLEKVATVL